MLHPIKLLLGWLLFGLLLPAAADETTVNVPEPPYIGKNSKVQQESAKAAAHETAKEDANAPVAAPEPPDLPMPVKSGEELEPDITIVRKGNKTLQEYRRNGEIYMIKVIPDKGPSYYLIDINGDGKLDVRGSDLDKGLSIHQWKLLEW